MTRVWLLTLVVALVALTSPPAASAEDRLAMSAGPASVSWSPPAATYERLVLTVSGPQGFHHRQEFEAGTPASFGLFDRAGFNLADGVYKYELRVIPKVDGETRRLMQEARARGDEGMEQRLRQEGKLPARPQVQSGAFTIAGGSVVPRDLPEPSAETEGAPQLATRATVLATNDGVIRNALCVGFDCPNSPTFGDTSILMMENNNRIKFDDTSVAPFPLNDWEIEANSASSGGLSYLGFNDCGNSSQGGCATDLVFAVEAGARQNALYVESDGDVGIGTSNPVLDLHIVTGNTPSIRLEQDGSGGFTAQTWDLAGNEASFFVRDVTGGSTLPFRIRPGAPSSSVDINADGDVGVGTGSPDASMAIQRSGSSATHQLTAFSDGAADAPQFIARRADGTSSVPGAVDNGDNLGLFSFRGHTGTAFSGSRALLTALATENWSTSANGAKLTFSTTANGSTSPTIRFEIQEDGDIVANGVVVHASSRALKRNFAAADPQAVLERVASLPVTYWNYTKDDPSERHIGPVAEDFYAAFGLGDDDKYIALSDSVGVALAAVQGLHQQLQAKDQEIADLKAGKDQEIAELRARLAAIEAALAGN